MLKLENIIQSQMVFFIRKILLWLIMKKTIILNNKDLKLFSKEYVGEQLLSPIMTYDKMKTCYPIQKIDLRFQVDHKSPEKIRLFEEYDNNPTNTIFYIILIKHREIKMISGGKKFISVEVV